MEVHDEFVHYGQRSRLRRAASRLITNRLITNKKGVYSVRTYLKMASHTGLALALLVALSVGGVGLGKWTELHLGLVRFELLKKASLSQFSDDFSTAGTLANQDSSDVETVAAYGEQQILRSLRYDILGGDINGYFSSFDSRRTPFPPPNWPKDYYAVAQNALAGEGLSDLQREVVSTLNKGGNQTSSARGPHLPRTRVGEALREHIQAECGRSESFKKQVKQLSKELTEPGANHSGRVLKVTRFTNTVRLNGMGRTMKSRGFACRVSMIGRRESGFSDPIRILARVAGFRIWIKLAR